MVPEGGCVLLWLGGSVRLKRPMRHKGRAFEKKSGFLQVRAKTIVGPMVKEWWPREEIRVAHLFRPTYALANVGHPSDFLRFSRPVLECGGAEAQGVGDY